MDDGVDDLLRDSSVAAATRSWATLMGGTVRAPLVPLRTHGYTNAFLFTLMFSRPVLGRGTITEKFLVKAHNRRTDEQARHEQARQSNPEFARRHLVRQIHAPYPVDAERILTFQEIVNDGLPVTTMDMLADNPLRNTFRVVAEALLNYWNSLPVSDGRQGRPTEITTVGDYLRRELLLAKALDGVSQLGGRLELVGPTGDWIVVDGIVLPNPLRMFAEDSPIGARRIEYVQGFAHGDLHGGNIVIPLDEDVLRPEKFRLVDLETFEATAPLTRDLACLLLTTLLRHVAPPLAEDGRGLPATQATALISKLLQPSANRRSPALPRVLDDLVDTADRIGRNAVKGGLGQEWQTQFRLSLIAQALICTTYDNLDEGGRRWCLRLAAETYAREFPSTASTPTPSGPPVLPQPASDQPVRPRTANRPPQQRPGGDVFDGGYADNVHAEPGSLHADFSRPARNASKNSNSATTARTGPTGNSIHPDPGVGSQTASQRPASLGEGVPHPRQPLNDGVAWTGKPAKRRNVPKAGLGLITAAVIGGAALGAVAGPGSIASDRPRGTTAPPPRSVPDVPDRGSSRDDARSRDEASQRLNDLALQVAALREPMPPGRYTFTCRRVWAPETSDQPNDPKTLYQEVRLWWNARRAGRSVMTTAVAHGYPAVIPDVGTYGDGELTEVLPLPAENPGALRDQLGQLLEVGPPARQNAAGALRLVARFHQNHLLTPRQRAALLSYLAGTKGITYRKAQVDQANRRGYAFSADDGEGHRDTLMFDEGGHLLNHELTTVEGALISYDLLLTSTRTDTTADRDCD
ncbi:hypothetical protein [Micromonospora sp. NPDC048839]|uniref:hypothetical protein n=1 Tax=Micromonospora sp. NPDC048839 TaxID=3155641 RepID=UPI0033E98667